MRMRNNFYKIRIKLLYLPILIFVGGKVIFLMKIIAEITGKLLPLKYYAIVLRQYISRKTMCGR